MPEWGFFCYRRPPHPTSRPWTITVAPGAASCGAAARPSPDVAPVTTATLASRSRPTLATPQRLY